MKWGIASTAVEQVIGSGIAPRPTTMGHCCARFAEGGIMHQWIAAIAARGRVKSGIRANVDSRVPGLEGRLHGNVEFSQMKICDVPVREKVQQGNVEFSETRTYRYSARGS